MVMLLLLLQGERVGARLIHLGYGLLVLWRQKRDGRNGKNVTFLAFWWTLFSSILEKTFTLRWRAEATPCILIWPVGAILTKKYHVP
jgi:hypothetical protein